MVSLPLTHRSSSRWLWLHQLTLALSPPLPQPTISWPQLYIKRTHVFIGIHYPACAEETAPFNWITDALAFKYLIVPSSSIPACSPLQKVAECSQFLASPNVISYHRAYVFEFFRLRAVSKHWAFYKQGQLLLRFYEVVLASSIWGLRRKHTYMGIF
jgi:hypothetical protein